MRCPDDESLIAYLDGELASKERGAVARHLESCESCRRRVEQFEELKRIVRDEGREGVAAGSARPPEGAVSCEPDAERRHAYEDERK